MIESSNTVRPDASAQAGASVCLGRALSVTEPRSVGRYAVDSAAPRESFALCEDYTNVGDHDPRSSDALGRAMSSNGSSPGLSKPWTLSMEPLIVPPWGTSLRTRGFFSGLRSSDRLFGGFVRFDKRPHEKLDAQHDLRAAPLRPGNRSDNRPSSRSASPRLFSLSGGLSWH